MGRQLTVFLPVPGDTRLLGAALLRRPEEWLPDGAVPRGPGVWDVPLRGAGMTRTVACTVGDPWQTGEGSWRTLRWEPVPEEGDVVPVERLLPVFNGELGLATSHGGPASLVLAGTYEVPASVVGQFVDAVLLARVARQTATVLLAEISHGLTSGMEAPAHV